MGYHPHTNVSVKMSAMVEETRERVGDKGAVRYQEKTTEFLSQIKEARAAFQDVEDDALRTQGEINDALELSTTFITKVKTGHQIESTIRNMMAAGCTDMDVIARVLSGRIHEHGIKMERVLAGLVSDLKLRSMDPRLRFPTHSLWLLMTRHHSVQVDAALEALYAARRKLLSSLTRITDEVTDRMSVYMGQVVEMVKVFNQRIDEVRLGVNLPIERRSSRLNPSL